MPTAPSFEHKGRPAITLRRDLDDAMERKKILVIDDEADMRTFLATVMTANGFQPVLAGDAAEGLRRARTECPACIILNAMIGGEGGVTLYSTLKTDAAVRDVPVLLLSALPGRTFFRLHPFPRGDGNRTVPRPEAFLETSCEAGEIVDTVCTLVESPADAAGPSA